MFSLWENDPRMYITSLAWLAQHDSNNLLSNHMMVQIFFKNDIEIGVAIQNPINSDIPLGTTRHFSTKLRPSGVSLPFTLSVPELAVIVPNMSADVFENPEENKSL